MEYSTFIKEIIDKCKYNSYLELGVSKGENIHLIRDVCDHSVGVDIIDIREHFGFKFYNITTDLFFQINKATFDVIFIDADHNFEQCKIDFINSLKILNRSGLILLHDTDPISKDFTRQEFCGDSYKIISWLRENYSDLDILTLPYSVTGLTLVNRKTDKRVYDFIKT